MGRGSICLQNKKDYKTKSATVEPMQVLLMTYLSWKGWMRGDANNRWLFASMELLSGRLTSIKDLYGYEKLYDSLINFVF